MRAVSAELTRFREPTIDEFRKILHWHGTMIQDGFMEATKVELVAEFALDLLSQTVVGHAADKVGAQLRRALFGPNDL